MVNKVFKQILMVYEIVFIHIKLFLLYILNCFMFLFLPLVTVSLKLMFIVLKIM